MKKYPGMRRKLKSDKKGDGASEGFSASGWLIIASIAVVLTFAPIFIKMLNAIIFKDVETGTHNSIVAGDASLAGKIDRIETGDVWSHFLYLKDGYKLLGFNKGALRNLNDKIDDGTKKPKSCEGAACICLCKDWDCKGEVKCRALGDDVKTIYFKEHGGEGNVGAPLESGEWLAVKTGKREVWEIRRLPNNIIELDQIT